MYQNFHLHCKTRENILSVANEWIGTPFHDQGRQKNFGCDCIGLIIGIAIEIGAVSLTGRDWKYCDFTTYNCLSDSHLLLSEMPKNFYQVHGKPMAGDILLIEIQPNQYHLCIYDEKRVIHSCSSVGKVVSHRYVMSWKIAHIFRYVFAKRDFFCDNKHSI